MDAPLVCNDIVDDDDEEEGEEEFITKTRTVMVQSSSSVRAAPRCQSFAMAAEEREREANESEHAEMRPPVAQSDRKEATQHCC